MPTKYSIVVVTEDQGNRTMDAVYSDDLSKEFELETGQQFYRAKLSGSIAFIGDDFDWLDAQAFETQFRFYLMKSVDGGLNWETYWIGEFYKTDGDWDEDTKKVVVKPTVLDAYSTILAEMDKEFNLIKLAPAKVEVSIDKRPLIQMYVPGDSTISCFLGGNAWEQDVAFEVPDGTVLIDTHFFALASRLYKMHITGTGTPADCVGEYVSETDGVWRGPNGVYVVELREEGPTDFYYDLIRDSDSVVMFTAGSYNAPIFSSVFFSAQAGSGTLSGSKTTVPIYARLLTNVSTVGALTTDPLPSEDLVAYNRNYRRAIGYAIDGVTITADSSTTPTEYGLREDGDYFVEPYGFPAYPKYYPLARNWWGLSSIWFNFELFDWILEEQGRDTFTFKETSMVSDVISTLLAEADPSLTHQATSAHSTFLYDGANVISGRTFRLMITQKSNILAGVGASPAQRAPLTLGEVLRMLKEVYQCYWFIDNGRLRIEHLHWFKNGGTYSASPSYTADLTSLLNLKNRKAWGFESSKYKYDKQELPAQIKFSWMDDGTEGFDGRPLDIDSPIVLPGKIEEINAGKFTTDIDFMLLNPTAINPDGFALFAAELDGGDYVLPYYSTTVDGAELRLQNGYASWEYIVPVFWVYDLPASPAKIGGGFIPVYGIKRTKKQEVFYPSQDDPNPMKLVKTALGDGQIEKISVNLSSRMNSIQLKHDTE